MRVPVNPQTQYPGGQLGYERAVDVTAGQRALAQVVGKYAEYAEDEQRKRQMFDVQKALVDETNNIQTDFEDKTKNEPLGAPNFVPRVNADYTARHTKMVQAIRDAGYSDDAVQEFETRLGTIRAQYVARAIDFQEKSSHVKVLNDSNEMVRSLSQYVNTNPEGLDSATSEFQTALAHSGLDAVEQAQIFDQGREIIRKSALEGFTIKHPDLVLGLYGFPNELKEVHNPQTGQIANVGQLQQTVLTNFQAAGLSAPVIAGFLGNFDIEGGYSGAKGDGGKASGIAQWHADRIANYEKATGKPYDPTDIDSQSKFVLWEMQNPKQAGMTVAQRDAILNAKTPQEAAELIDKYYERSSGKDRQKRIDAAVSYMSAHANATAGSLKPIPKDWKGNVEDAIQELGMTAEQAQTFISTGKDTRVAGQAGTGGIGPTISTEQAAQQFGLSFDANGKTGIAALDQASGPERVQMLTMARTIMNERIADAKAADREAHETYLNDFLNGLQDGKYGQADLDAAYASGKITDYDERHKAQSILDAKNKKDEKLVMFQQMIQSGQKFNPYDDDAQAASEVGFQHAVKYAIDNHLPTDPFTIALRQWQRTGILPKSGGVMIRGGLIGTEPGQVKAAASVASNMLKENPNAFAGVEGGDDIGKAASNYAHYVDDLGMTSDQAAQKIATENAPEFKAKQKADEPARNAFMASITGTTREGHVTGGINIDKVINDQVFGPRGFTSRLTFGAFDQTRGSFTESQRAEAKQTYLELALDHYDKYHDAGAANKYAADQMGRLYGVEGGRILKYPATKAYPEIMGNREYIFDQAKEEVDKFAGFAVPKEDIFLSPTSTGSTAAAFRAGRAPPYEITFLTHKDGQDIYHHIPGKVFVADVDRARKEAAKKAKEYETQIRRTVVFPGIGPVGG